MPQDRRAEYESKMTPGYQALELMDKTLVQSPFSIGRQCSIADISRSTLTRMLRKRAGSY